MNIVINIRKEKIMECYTQTQDLGFRVYDIHTAFSYRKSI